MTDDHRPAQPHDRSTPSGDVSEGMWNYIPRSAAAAREMVRRAHAAGRTPDPSWVRLCGGGSNADPEDRSTDLPSLDAASAAAGPELTDQPQPDPREREEDEGRDQPATHPAGRGWVPLSRDLGIPGEHGSEGPVAALGCSAVFTRELRVRFLDHLAFQGNVRAAAARVGVSHETAYRKRRQDAAFAALWDAALVHARGYSESQLATRALDGIEVPVWHRGEIVSYQVKHDTRLLLAHLARLDKRVENDAAARACAGRFDELLAGYAGHEAPEGFAEAAREALDWRERGIAPELPPTRAEYVAYCRDLALDAVAAGGEDDDEEARIEAEDEAMEDAGEEAGAEWDAWHGGALARVGAIVQQGPDELPSPLAGEGGAPSGADGEGSAAEAAACAAAPSPNPLPQGERAECRNGLGGDVPASPPYEVKSARAMTGRFPPRENRVTSVNPRDNCAVARGSNRPILPLSR